MFDVKFKASKLRADFPNARALRAMGERAFAAIEKRIRDRGVDASGKPVPPLKNDPSRGMLVPANDPRFPKGGQPSWKYWEGGKAKTVPPKQRAGREPPSRYFPGGYDEAKAAQGAKPKPDGALTGAMWRGATVTASTSSKGVDSIKLHFLGSGKGVGTRTTKGGKVKAATVENRLKAAELQKRRPDGSPSTRAEWRLLGLTDAELGELLTALREALHLKAG